MKQFDCIVQSPKGTMKGSYCVFSVLKMGKLRHREVPWDVPNHELRMWSGPGSTLLFRPT